MASKISALTALTSPLSDDVLPVVDVHDTTQASSGTTKKITVANLQAGLLQAANNLSDVTAATARTNLGLGTAATQSSAAFDTAGVSATETTRATTAEALLAPLASPTLTGTPTAPTQTAANNSTRLATTAYADAAVSTETTRATTAEALALLKTGGTMSGAIAMGTSKITGVGNGSGAQDVAAFGQIPVLDSTASDIQNTGPQAAGNSTKAAAANHVHFSSGMFLCAPVEYAPGSSTILTSTSQTLAAVSSASINTGSFTAPASGNVLVTASFVSNGTGTGVAAFALAAHGTVTPVVGHVMTIEQSSINNIPVNTIPFLVTGLTPGNSYNLDLLFAVSTGSTVNVRALGQTSTTPTAPSNPPVGPAVMTVQAV